MSQIEKIGVIGAGNMGSGIVQKIAQEGISVVMVDIKDEFVQRGMDTIRNLLNEGVERKIFTPAQVVLSPVISNPSMVTPEDCTSNAAPKPLASMMVVSAPAPTIIRNSGAP